MTAIGKSSAYRTTGLFMVPSIRAMTFHRMAIVQDGQTTAIEHYGRTGGLPFTGAGWYRTCFTVPRI